MLGWKREREGMRGVMSSNPFAGLLTTFGDLLHSIATAGRHEESQAKPSTEITPVLREVLAAVGKAYESTWLAFDTNVKDVSEFDVRDARAKNDAAAAATLFNERGDELPQELRPTIATLVERVEAAQLQLMAFAINRKNRGEPDAAQAEAELADRQAFREECGGSIARLAPELRTLLRPE